MQHPLKQIYIGLAALIIWFALGLQFYIAMPANFAVGRTMAGGIIHVLSYFTILTNLLVALAYTCILLVPASKFGKLFSRTSTLTSIGVYIGIVGFIYALVLRNLWNPQGLFKLADNILHYVSPILFMLFWFLFVPKQQLKWSLAINWLLFPFIYLIYSLIRGQISGIYPYFFMDIGLLGYKQTIINCLLVLIAFLSFGGIFILISRLLSSSRTKN